MRLHSEAAGHRAKPTVCLRSPAPRDLGSNPLRGFSSPPQNFSELKFLAEREGFEPPVLAMSTPDFESGTFGHSVTSPVVNSASERERKKKIGKKTFRAVQVNH